MKQLRKLKLKDPHLLSNPEMKLIEGGVSQGEYCATLSWQWEHAYDNGWSVGAVEGWWYGWSHHCM